MFGRRKIKDGTDTSSLSTWKVYFDSDPKQPRNLQARKSTGGINGYNMLCFMDGWEILYDSTGKSFLMNTSNRLKVIGAEGKAAYVDASKVTYCYMPVKKGGETRFIEIGGDNSYFVERKNQADENPAMIVDKNGNVESEKIEGSHTYSDCPYDDNEGFTPRNFDFDSRSHYSRCGAVPKRREYKALDSWETGGEKYQEMFFTTTRARGTN